MTTSQKLTFVIGGASSGKSVYAETLLLRAGRPMTYIATAQIYDSEMEHKVAIHRERRSGDWTTIEAPLEPGDRMAGLPAGGTALLDCLTFWLSNHLLAGSDLAAAEARLMEGIARCPCPLVVVSNEVGQGVVPDTPLGRQFRTAQGGLNQRLANTADQVIAVIAGLPLALKGTLP